MNGGFIHHHIRIERLENRSVRERQGQGGTFGLFTYVTRAQHRLSNAVHSARSSGLQNTPVTKELIPLPED